MNKQIFPNAIPGSGGVVSPATAAQMFADKAHRSWEKGNAAAQADWQALEKVPTYMAQIKAAAINAKQALATAEAAARESFARRNGFSPAIRGASFGGVVSVPMSIVIAQNSVWPVKISDATTDEDADDDEDEEQDDYQLPARRSENCTCNTNAVRTFQRIRIKKRKDDAERREKDQNSTAAQLHEAFLWPDIIARNASTVPSKYNPY